MKVKVGDMIKCISGMGVVSFGIIVKLEKEDNSHFPNALNGETWAEIVWAAGHRTWEEMEVSLETCFEVISEAV